MEQLPAHLPDCIPVTDERLAAAAEVAPEVSDANGRFLSAVCRELKLYRKASPNRFVTHDAALAAEPSGDDA